MKRGDYVTTKKTPHSVGKVVRVRKDGVDVRWYPGHKDGWSKRMPHDSLVLLDPQPTGVVYVPKHPERN